MNNNQRSADRRKYHIIYKTTCVVTNKYYIGMHSTDNLDDGYLGSGKIIWRSIKKYGAAQHRYEILEHLPSRDAVREREKQLVDKELICDRLCMNLVPGGGGGWVESASAETKVKQSSAMKAFWSSEEGLRIRAEYRQMSRPFPEAAKPLASEKAIERIARMKADGSWQAVVEKNRAAHLGKKLTVGHKQKLGDANRRYKELHGKKIFSEQARSKIAASLTGNSRNKKQWTLIDLATKAELVVYNLSAWLHEHQLTAPTYYVKQGSQNIYLIKESYDKFMLGRDAKNALRRMKRQAEA